MRENKAGDGAQEDSAMLPAWPKWMDQPLRGTRRHLLGSDRAGTRGFLQDGAPVPGKGQQEKPSLDRTPRPEVRTRVVLCLGRRWGPGSAVPTAGQGARHTCPRGWAEKELAECPRRSWSQVQGRKGAG